jgi:hypothetical protein
MEADPVTSADPDSFGCEEVKRVCFQFLPDVSPPVFSASSTQLAPMMLHIDYSPNRVLSGLILSL